MSDIAVFYLARLKEGFAHFAAFAQSLRKHPAGIEFDLIIICKGFQRPSELAVVASIFKGIPHQITMVDDEIGQDIHSYKAAAARFPHTYVCFMNTFTEVNSDLWLKKLFDAISLPNVGMVGATGSFESLNNSWELIDRVCWAVTKPVAFDEQLTRSFEWIIRGASPATVQALRSPVKRVRRMLGDKQKKRPAVSDVVEEHRAHWASVSAEGAPYGFTSRYPYFPNPHIRSNAFMLRREEVLRMPLRSGDSKLAGCEFESGPDGLSARLLKRGERLLLVGGNGQAYEIDDWMNAGCFRSAGQTNLLVVDNQTKSIDRQSDAERKIHSTMAWGSYLDGNPDSVYGVPFDSVRPLADFTHATRPSGKNRLFSIVIPTHNRLQLTLDAIKTVIAQDYQNWEIVVFDNASDEDVGTEIRKLQDDRIRCERSDEFLPVTRSWNRALNMARGDYVTLIGDDDGLLPGFFERISELADRFDDPDVVLSSLLQFFHPGVLPWKPLGVVQRMPTADFMDHRDYPFVLDRKAAKAAVDSSLGLRRSFMFNMPAYTVRKHFLDSIRRDGEVLHPPFPDYYFANLVLDRASKVVVEPQPIAFQGISTSSFGFTLFNQKTEDGFKVLGHELQHDSLYPEVGHHLLPGPGYHSQYIMTMAHVAKALGDPARQPDFHRYRRLQVHNFLASREYPFTWAATAEGKLLADQLSFAEIVDAYRMVALHRLAKKYPFWRKMSAALDKGVSMHAFSPVQTVLNEGDYVSGPEIFKALQTGRLRS